MIVVVVVVIVLGNRHGSSCGGDCILNSSSFIQADSKFLNDVLLDVIFLP